jgi:hypothetical protein
VLNEIPISQGNLISEDPYDNKKMVFNAMFQVPLSHLSPQNKFIHK